MCTVDQIIDYGDKVMNLVDSGFSQKTISQKLNISEETVRTIINFYNMC